MLLFIFLDKNEFKNKAESELAKKVVTFYKNENKEVLKHTINYFKKQNVPVRTIYNIVAKYRKRNSTSYLPRGDRLKKISDQQLQTLINLVDKKADMSQCRLGRRFDISQSTITRNLKKGTLVRIYKRRSAPKYKNEDPTTTSKIQLSKIVQKTYSRLSTDTERRKIFYTKW